MYAHEVHAYEVHAREVYAHEVHAHGIQACEVQAHPSTIVFGGSLAQTVVDFLRSGFQNSGWSCYPPQGACLIPAPWL
jgi:hypothetical protein